MPGSPALTPKPPVIEEKKKHSPVSPPDTKPQEDPAKLRFKDVGVWTIMWDEAASWKSKLKSSQWKFEIKMLGVIPLILNFLLECTTVGPDLVITYLVTTLWTATESAATLYFSSRILNIIQEVILLDHRVKTQSLVTAIMSHAAFSVVCCLVQRLRETTKEKLANRIRYLFEVRMIQANLRLDFPTFQEPETLAKTTKYFGHGTRGGAWEVFEDLVDRFQGTASVLSQLGFIISVLRGHPGSGWLAVACAVKAAFDHLTYESIWSRISYVWASNPHYRRMSALRSIVTGKEHRIEVVSNVLADYIHREWSKARKLLGDLSDNYPDMMLYMQKPLLVSCFDRISGEFPLMFYAFQVLRHPSSFSLTSVALLQQASASLGYTLMGIVNVQHSLQQRINDIRTMYENSNIPNQLPEGELEYPRHDVKPAAGMEISFQNVSFAYPLAENVIKDVSFTIRRGQTIMIVGENGSGKSTLLKLFNRLYDPTSGNILVDGVPMNSYKPADLRRASAMLFQTFTHYPLTIQENIRLGLPDTIFPDEDEKGHSAILAERVREAARLGGSFDFVEEQSNGFDTVLRPDIYGYSSSYSAASEQFEKKVKEINKKADVSSGQWQRLALSRLFFRAAAEDIKLVAVDEPTASLDPKMEYALFESLRNLSSAKGKTLVFVTHRFGYLTKRADLILVMQKGRLVEQGKHDDLLQMGGEYANLYKLQAEAFLSDNDLK